MAHYATLTASADELVRPQAGSLKGFSFRNVGTDQALLYIRDLSVTGSIMAIISLSPGESVRDWFGDIGIYCTGLFVDIVSGTVEGVVYT